MGGIMSIFLCLLAAWSFVNASAEPREDRSEIPIVDEAQFQLGHTWVWLYSQKSDVDWVPYYFEKYKVVDRKGSILTIDMVSWKADGYEQAAHHRIVVNLRQCGPRGKMPASRGLKIAFWTRSPKEPNEWQLISRNYSHLAFTEKFNCFDRIGPDPIVVETKLTPLGSFVTAAFRNKLHVSGNSAYISHKGPLYGVAAEKTFQPRQEFRFQLIEARALK
jgi:hypothetical protein